MRNHTLPFTNELFELFGDDVSKKAKEIEDCNKIGYKIHKSARGGFRGRSSFRGRFRVEEGGPVTLVGPIISHINHINASGNSKKRPEKGDKHDGKGINSQVKNFSNFEAGRLRFFIQVWCKLTDDPVILDMREHFHVEFEESFFLQSKSIFHSINLRLRNLRLLKKRKVIYSNWGLLKK